MIVLGDIHLGVKGNSSLYHSIAIDLFDKVCEYAHYNDIEYLVQVGDLFDNRKALTHSTIDTALSIADKVDKSFKQSFFIVGNHDTANKDTMFPHGLMIFNKYKNITVVDKPTTFDRVLMLPWIFDAQDMVDASICMGHFDINGAIMNSSNTKATSHRLNFSDFSKYDLTVSGHYHTPGVYENNVRYIGTPYQLSFNDIGSERGFYVLNTDIPSLDFVRFDDYPHHYVFTDKSDIATDISGQIVKLVFTDNYGIDGNKEIIDRFRSMGPLSLNIVYVNSSEGMSEDTVSHEVVVKDKIDILYEFFDKSDIPEGINIDVLKKISSSIYKEIKNV